MGFALRHPLARGALNFAWHEVTRAAGTRADPMPTPPAGDIYVHYACDADPEGTPIERRSIGRGSSAMNEVVSRSMKVHRYPSFHAGTSIVSTATCVR